MLIDRKIPILDLQSSQGRSKLFLYEKYLNKTHFLAQKGSISISRHITLRFETCDFPLTPLLIRKISHKTLSGSNKKNSKSNKKCSINIWIWESSSSTSLSSRTNQHKFKSLVFYMRFHIFFLCLLCKSIKNWADGRIISSLESGTMKDWNVIFTK